MTEVQNSKKCPASCGWQDIDIYELMWHWSLAHPKAFKSTIQELREKGIEIE